MIIVNLLPEHLRPIKRTPIPYMITGLILSAAVLAMVYVWGVGLQTSRSKNQKLSKTIEALDNYGDVVDEYNELQNQKVELAKKVKIINDIVGDRIVWSYQLWKLSTLTPDNVWYDGIEVTKKQFKETRFMPDPKSKADPPKMKEVTETVKRDVLEVQGKVVPDKDGLTEVFPLTRATVKDPEFSELFELRAPTLGWDSVEGTPVRTFTLEYFINSNGEDAG